MTSDSLVLSNKKERVQYIDALRGFTMLLVVIQHVETFGFYGPGVLGGVPYLRYSLHSECHCSFL